ncbi:MAG: hypothetical protein AAF629_30640 [Chloroflexota bacterium]
MNISPNMGTASFPEAGVTFEQLVEIALEDIQSGQPVASSDSAEASSREQGQTNVPNESQLITEKV